MSNAQTRTANEITFALDRTATTSLPAQLATELRTAINTGLLRAADPLPATRALASRLGVARGVVVAAYEQLIVEGYLFAGQGKGTRVADHVVAGAHSVSGTVPARAQHKPQADATLQVPSAHTVQTVQTAQTAQTVQTAQTAPLVPGAPDISALATASWRAAWRHASTRAHLNTPDAGDPALRTAIAEHLRVMRGTARPAAQVLVSAGSREGLSLLLTALGTTRGRSLVVGVEDPGYPSLRRVAIRHGAQIVALPVDNEGLVTEQLPERLLDVVIVTPSHQYPLGGSLPLQRRHELLVWARRNGVVIVEDDYDSELRHQGAPLPALAALDDSEKGSVVLLGTFSKTVSPALSAGYILAPDSLAARLETVRSDLGGPVPAVVQAALAEFLGSGELRRHTARMRRRYARRRAEITSTLASVPGIRVLPMSGGLHAVIELVDANSGAQEERRLVASAARLGAVPLSGYWHSDGARSNIPGTATLGVSYGLVIGAGGSADETVFSAALQQLRACLLG